MSDLSTTNCKNWKFLFGKKGQKNMLRQADFCALLMLFYDIYTIDGQKFSLIIFYSTFNPIFTRLVSVHTDNCINPNKIEFNYTFSIDLAPNGISFGTISIRKV